MKEWEKDVEYTVTGQKETVTIGFKYEEDDVLTPTVTGDAVVEDVLAEERWIYNPETDEDGWKMVPYRIVLNCGSAVSGSVKVQVTPQKGNERGLASNKLSIKMVPRKSSAGAVGMRSQIVEDEETGASSRMIRFGNANTSAVRFTVSVRRSYLDEAENIAEPDADGYYMCFTAADAQAEGGYTDDGGNTVTYDPQTDTYSIEFSGLEDGAYTILVETFDSEDKRYLVKKAEYRFEKNDYVGMEIIDY